MGVLNLWQILDPVKQHQDLSELKGQLLAVDLSIWVCETQCVKQMQGVVSKPFLRNLFFRILHLLQLGVHLVFVVEGEAPDLKKDTMNKRQQERFHSKGQGYRGPRGGAGKGGRRNFNARLRECCRMLDCLGIPYLHSNGEAEAFCAALDAAGLVDGCLTNDGDAFLYGARTVYRNFTMNSKDPHVESYSMNNIEGRLGLDREKLVAMALLLGCDYLPKGVPGVGVDKAIKLTTSLKGYSILDRFHKWRRMSDNECVDQIESLVRKKALVLQDFPQDLVIGEFLTSKDKCPAVIKSWKRPQIADLQNFALDKMEWVVEYTLEKVLPLVTLWDMAWIHKQGHSSGKSGLLQPIRIVKSRTRQGVLCYEVEWHKPETDTISPQDVYTTVETQDLFSKCYPQFVQQYDEQMATRKTKGKSTRKKKDVEEQSDLVKYSQALDDDLSQAVSNLSLTSEHRSQVRRIKEGNVKLSTEEQGYIREEMKYSKDAKLNVLHNTDSFNAMLPQHVGHKENTAGVRGHIEAPPIKIEKSLKIKGKLKVKAEEVKKSKIKLSDFTSDLSLKISGNIVENHRENVSRDMLIKTGKQNIRTDKKIGSGVSSQDVMCMEEVRTTDEECSDDEAQDYIPLSQRVQINLKKALSQKQKDSAKDNTSNVKPANLDVSSLCTMLGSVKKVPGSQQLSSQREFMLCQSDLEIQTDTFHKAHSEKQTDTFHKVHSEKQTDTFHNVHSEKQIDRVGGFGAHLTKPVTSTTGEISSKTDKDSLGSGPDCTLTTAKDSGSSHISLNIEKVKQETKNSVSRMSVKGICSVKSKKGIKSDKVQKLCMESKDLQPRKIVVKDDEDKLYRCKNQCKSDVTTSALTDKEDILQNTEDIRSEAKPGTCTEVPAKGTRNNTLKSHIPSTEQYTYHNSVGINVDDSKVMTIPSRSVATQEKQGIDTLQINVLDISQLSPRVNILGDLAKSPNCSQDLFNVTEFSCLEKINFTVSTPSLAHCLSNNQMTSCDLSEHECQSDTPPVCNRKPLYCRQDSCRPVLVQETPCRTERRVSFHHAIMDQRSFTTSPQSVLVYDESLNITGSNKSVLEFGNFQIESSLLRSMDRGHESIDQSQDISGMGDLSHDHSGLVGNDDAQNQHDVLGNFEIQRKSPVSCLKKGCIQLDSSPVLSADTNSRDQKWCLASRKQYTSNALDGVDKDGISILHQHKEQTLEFHDKDGHDFPGYNGMDGSLGFTFVGDGQDDHCISSSTNMEDDDMKLCELMSVSNEDKMSHNFDVVEKHSNQLCSDITDRSTDSSCSETSENLVSGHVCEQLSGEQDKDGTMKRRDQKFDKKLQGKRNMVRHLANMSSSPSQVKEHMKILDGRIDDKKENRSLGSVFLSDSSMDTMDRSLGNIIDHSDVVFLPSEVLSSSGKDSVLHKSSQNQSCKSVTDRTEPELQKVGHVSPTTSRMISTSTKDVVEHSPVALADRLRARLRKASDRSVLGDITGNRQRLGKVTSGEQGKITIVID